MKTGWLIGKWMRWKIEARRRGVAEKQQQRTESIESKHGKIAAWAIVNGLIVSQNVRQGSGMENVLEKVLR